MRDRVFGIETEYAVIYHPGRGEEMRPNNLQLFQLFDRALAGRVRGLPRAFSLLRAKPGCFLENGGSFHYEATPAAFEHGLIEMASPECRDPFDLLHHERAKDELLEAACGEVNTRLDALGFRGRVGIGKNNVDSQGHTFGSHENYWVEDVLPRGRKLLLLPLWLAVWALTLPILLWLLVASAGVVVAGVAVALLPLAGLALSGLSRLLARPLPGASRRLRRASRRAIDLPRRTAERLRNDPGELARRLEWVEAPLRPAIAVHSWLHNQFHFRRFHRHLTAFLVTRAVFAGAGAVVFDGGPLLRLAQRPPFLRSLARIFTSGDDRPLYESRDIFFRPWSALGSRRRLHLLLADANLCDWAFVLRVGATALVLEAIESGSDERWPELARPLHALAELNADPALERKLRLAGGDRASALEIQRAFLAGVRRSLGEAAEQGWRGRVLAMWQETLDLLGRDPDALADRLDWLAKRRLLQREIPAAEDWQALATRGDQALDPAAPGADPRLRDLAYRALRVDLRYHELGPRGGHRRLVRRREVRGLADPEAVARARREPPRDTRASGRGAAIVEAHAEGLSGAATWHRVRVGLFRWRWFTDPLRPGPTLRL